MNSKINIKEKAIGKLKIFINAKDKVNSDAFWKRIGGRQTYREILQHAKKDGLMTASVYQTHGGFSPGGGVIMSNTEIENPGTILCVELIDEKDELESFCKRHYLLLKDKVIIFKAVKYWTFLSE